MSSVEGEKLALDREKFRKQMRFNYAWNWFEFHARQRTTMFNFFMVAVGIFFAAYGSLLALRAEHVDAVPRYATTILLSLGALASLLFFSVDFRNSTFVHMAEDLLERMEDDGGFFRDDIFLLDKAGSASNCANGKHLGLLTRERDAPAPSPARRRVLLGPKWWFTSHAFVIGAIEFLAFAAFVALLVNEYKMVPAIVPRCGTAVQESQDTNASTKGDRDNPAMSSRERGQTTEEAATSPE